jgi:opacity protein-like surface antigen
MFKRLAVAAVTALLSTSAFAADVLPVKATPFISPASCTLTNCSGWYFGGGLSGNGSSGDVSVAGIPINVFAGGTILDAHAGYQVWNGSALFAVEAGIGNQFSNGPISGQFGTSTLMGYEGVKLGGSLSGLLGTASSASSTVPGQASGSLSVFSSLENQMISPYVWLGAVQRGGFNQGTVGAGVEYVVAKSWNLDARYVYAPALGNLAAMQQITLGLNYHFTLK